MYYNTRHIIKIHLPVTNMTHHATKFENISFFKVSMK